jgi:hypothetical protein
MSFFFGHSMKKIIDVQRQARRAEIIAVCLFDTVKKSNKIEPSENFHGDTGMFFLVGWCHGGRQKKRGWGPQESKKRRMKKVGQEGQKRSLEALPKKLWEDKREYTVSQPARSRMHEETACGPSCRERGKLWKEELFSLATLAGAVASLLTVSAPSEGAEVYGLKTTATRESVAPHQSGVTGLFAEDTFPPGDGRNDGHQG